MPCKKKKKRSIDNGFRCCCCCCCCFCSGAVPSPFDCYLVNRGLKTLAVRMRQHMTSALRIANYLEDHQYVERVIYPGLPSHPQHELYKKQISGFSGMISVYLKGDEVEKSKRFLGHLKVRNLNI